jgi:chromate transporter
MGEAREPVLVKAFIAKLAVERFDVRILRRLARLNQFQRHAVRIRPLVERPARKFRSLVGSQRFGIAPETCCSVQRSRDVQAGDAVVHDDIDSLLEADPKNWAIQK